MIHPPTPKSRKQCLPPPGCRKLAPHALPRCQQTNPAQILHSLVSRKTPSTRFVLTRIETVRLRNARLLLERREGSQVHRPLLHDVRVSHSSCESQPTLHSSLQAPYVMLIISHTTPTNNMPRTSSVYLMICSLSDVYNTASNVRSGHLS